VKYFTKCIAPALLGKRLLTKARLRRGYYEESPLRTQTLKKHFALLVLLGAVMALLLAACSTETPAMTDGSEETALTIQDTALEIAVLGAAEEGSQTDDDETTAPDDVADSPEQVNACLNCHSDKEQLIATAAPEVEVTEEDEGEG
jgi:nitrate reductase cytochrome c-type subunit